MVVAATGFKARPQVEVPRRTRSHEPPTAIGASAASGAVDQGDG
jgi:hypothetical protein